MIGDIYVAETPYFARSGGDGHARQDNLPAGRDVLRVRHPRMELSEEAPSRPVSLERAGVVSVTGELELTSAVRPRRAPCPEAAATADAASAALVGRPRRAWPC